MEEEDWVSFRCVTETDVPLGLPRKCAVLAEDRLVGRMITKTRTRNLNLLEVVT